MKRGISRIIALSLAGALTACGHNSAGSNTAAAKAAAETKPHGISVQESMIQETAVQEAASQEAASRNTTARSAYPVAVTDQLGREVTIEEAPERIVSGYYISTSLLLALNQQEKLVGIEAKAKERSIYRLSAPEIVDLPNVGTAKEFDLEGCAALEPDLVIVPARLKDVIPSLEELGLTVIAVNPEDQELLEEAMDILAAACKKQDQAKALHAFIEQALSDLKEKLEGTEAPTVYLAGNSALLSTAGPAMYQNSMIVNAGGKNAAGELSDSYWAEISYEQLLAWNPDYIILASDASYTVDSVLDDPTLSDCSAVRNGNVYQLPNAIEAWDSPVPGSVLGSLWLANVLHPEQYTVEMWEQSAVEFYETFYRFTPEFENLYAAE